MANNGAQTDAILMGILDTLRQIEDFIASQSGKGAPRDAYTQYARSASSTTVSDPNMLNKAEIKSLIKEFKDNIRSAGLSTKEFTARAKELEKALLQKSKDAPKVVSQDFVERAIAASLSKWARESEKRTQAGQDPILNFQARKAQGNPLAKDIQQAFMATVNPAFDSATQKIVGFFQAKESREVKRTKTFISDFVDALGKNKTFMGALGDLARIVTFFAASIIRNFGTLGKVIAGALVVLAPTFGAIVQKAVLAGIGRLLPFVGSVLSKSLGFLGKLGGGLLRLGGNALGRTLGSVGGGALTRGIAGNILYKVAPTAVLEGMTASSGLSVGSKIAGGLGKVAQGASKALPAVSKALPMAAKGLGRFLPGVGALVSGAEAISTWKQASREGDGMKKVGAGLFGVSAIASAIAPLLGPLAPIAYGISIVTNILGTMFKLHKEIGDFFKKVFGKIAGIVSDWFDKDKAEDKEDKEGWFSGITTGIKDAISGFGASGTSDVKAAKRPVATTSSGLQIAADGSIINAASMTQKQFQPAIEAYRAQNREQFNRVYEVISNPALVSMASFKSDKVMRDEAGKLGAILYAGASKDLIGARGALAGAGLSQEKISQLRFTGGWGSAGGPHKIGSWKSHGNQYALGFDLGTGGQWSQSDWEKALPIVRDYYKQLGFDVKFESAGGLTSDPSKIGKMGLKNAHFDIKPLKDVASAGAAKAPQPTVKVDDKQVPIDEAIAQGKTSSTKAEKPVQMSTMADKPKPQQQNITYINNSGGSSRTDVAGNATARDRAIGIQREGIPTR